MVQRRSGRLAQKANSRASSVVSDNETATNNTADVITAFADRYRGVDDQLEEYEIEIEKLKKERDAEREKKSTLRHAQLEKQIAKQLAEQRLEAERLEASKKEQALVTSSLDTDMEAQNAIEQAPAAFSHTNDDSQMDVDADLAGELSNTPTIQNPPATSPDVQSEDIPFETPASKSFFSRILKPLGHFFSPTPAKSKPQPPSSLRFSQTQQIDQPQQPLGELPAKRKRPVPEPETEVTETSKTFTPTRITSTPKATRTTPRANKHTYPEMDIPDTITEYTEESEPSIRATPAPTRTPARTPARRGIQQVRSERQRKQMQQEMTPARDWDRTPAPRQPNADARLAKLQMMNKMQQQLKELQDDAEEEGIMEPPRKKVRKIKADEYDQLPHRRPGDSESTFRMPEVDSDGEMEVDEDLERKKNVFQISQAEEAQKEKEQRYEGKGKQAVYAIDDMDTAPETVQGVKNAWAFPSVNAPPAEVQDVWAFPTVGTRPAAPSESEMDDFFRKKFDLGLAGYLRGQQLVEW